ncbi:Hypothetical protein GSB_154683 [Giardia duodenalis]|uniref:Uncharacterized protein n=1 Tax=Giardia intestinalis TaxID=5741 RepID=V6TNT5_GIAIN|nr:Hypothetical protein GSB_154683 [Giardia intestinalis]
MEEPSLSELEQMAQYLQRRITDLKIDAPAAEVPLSGNVIPAGSVFYCRPSRLNEMVKRLGGSSNVQIMDTADTRGFCRGKAKPALPWTNEVYPTDIGPSCAGIDSDTPRIVATVNNNCITPTAWDPIKLFRGSSQRPQQPFYANCYMAKRILYLHPSPLDEYYYKTLFRPELLTQWGKVLDPRISGMDNFPSNAFRSIDQTIIISTNTGGWYGSGMTMVNQVSNYDELVAYRNNVFGYGQGSFALFPDSELCLIQYGPTRYGAIILPVQGGCLMTPTTPAQCIPFKVSVFQVRSNEILSASSTPVLKYGGYDRKNPPGSGPPPAWGRTNIVQIKTLRDVAVTLRAPEEDGGAGEGNK